MGKPVEIELLMRDKTSSTLDKVGKSASAVSDKIDKASNDITRRIAEQDVVVKQIESDLKSLEKQYARLSPGKAQQEMRAEINACKRALEEEKAALSGLNETHQQTAVSSKRLSAQLREMQNALAQMRIEGKENTKEYRQMAEQAANLSDTIGDTSSATRILADDNARLSGIMSGASGLAGAFTTATGLMSLMNAENEDLIKIQTKLQSVMAITMGIQQVMNALNKDSAFRLVTLARAKATVSAANLRLGKTFVQAGMSATGAKVAISALYATLTLGISAAVTLAISAWSKYSDAKEKVAEATKKTIQTEEDARAAMLKAQFELDSYKKKLSDFNGTKDQERAMIEELSRKYGEQLGYYDSIATWYDTLQKKGEDYIQMLFLQAKAQTLIQEAVEADKKVNEIKANGKESYRPFWGKGGTASMFLGGSNKNAQGSDPAALAYNKDLKEAQSARDNALNAAAELQQMISELGSKSAIGGFTAKSVTNQTTDPAQTLAGLEEKSRRKIEDQALAIMKDGYAKKREVAKLEFEREKERIEKEEKEKLALYAQLEKSGKADPVQKQGIAVQAGIQKTNAAAIYDKSIAEINKDEASKESEHLLKLLEPYRTFAQQRLDIEAKYNADMDALRKAGASEDNMDIAREQQQAALDELDLVLAQKDVTFQAFMNQVANMSLAKLNDALSQAESALSKSEAANGKSSDQSAILRAKVNALKNEIKYLQAENAAKPDNSAERWKKNSIAIKSCKAEVDGMLSSMTFLDEATREALQAASNVADGAIAMIDGIQTLSIGAAEGISAVEKASVILAIVGAAVKIVTAIFNMASAAEERHQKALEEVASNKLAMQRQYNLLLLEQNLLMKEASSIFGEQSIAKAARSIEVYRQALSDLHSEMKGNAPKMNLFEMMTGDATGSYKERLKKYQEGILQLSEITIKTGHKKTGLFGWGKGKDIYSSVLEVYDDLIDAEGNLNIERAKAILETQTMSDANKELLQNMVDLQEQAEEALESLRDYLEQTFGSLGDGILESIESAIRDGGINAWEEFGDKGSEVLESLGRQMAYSLFFAEKFKKLQAQLEGVYGSGKSEEEIANEAMQVVGDFYAGIGKDMEDAQDWMEQWKQKAAEHGFDLWSQEDAAQSGRSGAFETMTQDQGTKLEGLFTSVQGHVINMDDNLENVVGVLHSNMDKLTEIEENTSYCKRLDDVVTELEKIRRDGIKVK